MRLRLHLCMVILTFLAVGDALAQATATGQASCTIVEPLMIVNDSALAFGQLSVSPTSGGTVTVVAPGDRSATGAISFQGQAWTAAQFTVTGQDGANYVVALPDSCSIQRTGGSEEMLVDAFTCSPGVQGTLAGGSVPLSVGATLHVGAAQPIGAYVGSFEVTVAYQ